MTTPLTDPNAPPKVSILGRIFGKVQQAPQPPAGIEDRLSYTDTVGSNGTDAAYFFHGSIPNMDSPHNNGYFNTIAEADSVLTHFDRPPADQNPQAWWDDRNTFAKQQRETIEHQEGVPWMGDTSKPGPIGDNPNWVTPTVNRTSAFLSPSQYRFTRPFDQDTEHTLNGVHLSLADNRRAYMLAGNVGQVRAWNNSYRVDPTSNDAGAVFVGDTLTNTGGTTVLYNTDVSTRPSYRL